MRKFHLSILILLATFMLALPAASPAQISVGVSVHIGPPALPVYVQPVCPGAGYIWTPGYWAYGPDGYYWVPGTWVIAPAVGLLWTPGYWGWGGGLYVWHAGYWGPHVGFYGGINYGFGYGGVGFVGGRWNHGVFAYNTAVTHVDTTVIHNTYVNKTVINNVTVNHVSYNGGTGGTTARPNAEERSAMQEHHFAPTSMQTQHEHGASTNRALLASENHGRPAIAATSRPGQFSGRGVVAASNAPHNFSNNSNRPNNAEVRHADRPPSARGGNASSNAARFNNNGNSSRANNAQNERNTAHAENRPRPENRPRAQSQPREESKPHPENKPEHRESGKPHR